MARSNTIEIIIKAKDSASGPLKSITGGLTKIGKIAGGIALGGVAALGAGVAAIATQAIPAASDLEESINKVNVVFGESSPIIQKFAQNAATALGQSQAQALEAAGTYGNLLTSIGITTDKAADMSVEIVQLASDLASFNNASPEETLLALRSALTGEFEPMKRFGTALNQAAVQQKALDLGLIKTKDDLTPAIKAQAAYALILEQTTNAQGDFARTSEGLANSQRIIKAQFEDLRATIGLIFLPIAEKAANFVSTKILPTLNTFAKYIGFVVDEGDPLNDFLADLPEGLQPIAMFLGELIPKFKNLFEVIMDAGPLSIEAKEALGAIFGEEFIDALFRIKDAIGGVYEIIRLLITGDFRGGIFGMMEDDPFISALFTFREILQNAFDTVSNFISSIDWDAVGGTIASAFELIAGAVGRIDWETLGGIISDVFERISDIVSSIDWAAIGQTISEAFNSVSGAISSIDWASIGELVGEIANTVIDAFGTVRDWFDENWPAILEFVTEVWSGIQQVIGSAIDMIVGEAWPALVEAFETIKSVLEESGINWQVLLDLLGAVAAFIGVTLVVAFVTLIGIVTGVVTGVANALSVMAGHFAALKETGARIIESLSQVISGFVDLVTSLIHGDWAGAWEAAKQIFSGAIDLIANLVTGIVQVFVGNFQAILAFIGGFIEGVVGFFTNLYERLIGGSTIPDMLKAIVDEFVNKFNEIIDFVSSLIDRFVQLGSDIIDGIKQGLLNAWGGLTGLFSQLISGLPEWAKRLLGIGSPSKVFVEIGENITKSLGMGVENAIRSTQSIVSGMVSSVVSSGLQPIPVTSGGAFAMDRGGQPSNNNYGGDNITNNFFNQGATALALAAQEEKRRARLKRSIGMRG